THRKVFLTGDLHQDVEIENPLLDRVVIGRFGRVDARFHERAARLLMREDPPYLEMVELMDNEGVGEDDIVNRGVRGKLPGAPVLADVINRFSDADAAAVLTEGVEQLGV